jgi:uncharacterized protein YeaO (DUF488 family)
MSPFQEVPVGVIKIFRVYSDPGPSGKAYLVERLRPRDVGPVDVAVDGWLKDIASPTRLEAHPQSWQSLVNPPVARGVTLLYSFRDRKQNDIIALRHYPHARTTPKRAA